MAEQQAGGDVEGCSSADSVEADCVDILLVEDNPGDVKLTRKAFERGAIANRIDVVNDGIEAMEYLRERNERIDEHPPDLVLLDLKLPRMSGREVLEEIKSDPDLKRIPVVVLTSSEAEQDIFETYNDHANAYLTKPVSFEGFRDVVTKIEGFWFCVAKLPPK